MNDWQLSVTPLHSPLLLWMISYSEGANEWVGWLRRGCRGSHSFACARRFWGLGALGGGVVPFKGTRFRVDFSWRRNHSKGVIVVGDDALSLGVAAIRFSETGERSPHRPFESHAEIPL